MVFNGHGYFKVKKVAETRGRQVENLPTPSEEDT